MSSKDFGLGPKWWQQPGNKLQKCSERFSQWCDPTETDGCCAVIPCVYCLELEIYGQAIQRGASDFSTNGWSGSVGGGTFFGFWEVGNGSGKCEFVVQWNGEEVYRKSCDDGQSCRDSSDEAAVIFEYEDAVLRWSKHEYRSLPYVKDPVTSCTIHFCGDCECTCEELCYSFSNLALSSSSGTIPQLSYTECDGPTWGTSFILDEEEYAIFAELVKDPETGECIFQVSLNGEPLASLLIDNCKEISGSWELYGGGTLTLSCKKCSCSARTGCCPNLSSTLYVTLDLTSTPYNPLPPLPGVCPYARIYGTIPLSLIVEGAAAIWASELYSLTSEACGTYGTYPVYAVVNCSPEGLYLSVGTNPSATAGVIWKAFYAGCNGGFLTACDPEVETAFGGLDVCTNWGSLSA